MSCIASTATLKNLSINLNAISLYSQDFESISNLKSLENLSIRGSEKNMDEMLISLSVKCIKLKMLNLQCESLEREFIVTVYMARL